VEAIDDEALPGEEAVLVSGSISRRAVVGGLAGLLIGAVPAEVPGEAKKRKGGGRRPTRGKRTRPGPKRTARRPKSAPPAVALGAFVAGAPHDPERLDRFAKLVGRMPAVVAYYHHWGGPTPAFAPALPKRIIQRGAAPLITWEPWVPNGERVQPAYRLKSIANGDYDDYARSWANGLKAVGKPVYLRFAHEMNGDWYPWCVGVNENTAEEYIAAWRRLHGIFVEAQATNVRWVWSPNVDYPGATPMAEVYPGHDVVDWVALDGYNFGATRPDLGWRSFATTFGASYDQIRRISGGKPLMIAETASAEAGGNKAGWITRGLGETLRRQFPAVKAVVWFHENKETDWRVNSSAAALAAYREVVASPAFRGKLP
jgi:hypothetical protein